MKLLRKKCWHGETRWLNMISCLLWYQNRIPVWARLTPTFSLMHWRIFSEGCSHMAFIHYNSSSLCEHFFYQSDISSQDMQKQLAQFVHAQSISKHFEVFWILMKFIGFFCWGLVSLEFFNELGLVCSSKGQGRSDTGGIFHYYSIAFY